MSTPLSQEFEYYIANQDQLVKAYNGRYVVIKDKKVIGTYKDQLEAVQETKKQGHEAGTFLVQKVEPGASAYTEVFHSRVAFA